MRYPGLYHKTAIGQTAGRAQNVALSLGIVHNQMLLLAGAWGGLCPPAALVPLKGMVSARGFGNKSGELIIMEVSHDD